MGHGFFTVSFWRYSRWINQSGSFVTQEQGLVIRQCIFSGVVNAQNESLALTKAANYVYAPNNTAKIRSEARLPPSPD
ncbi:hypothetical protein [Ochrobactrum sp. MYb379]|uniref:hypothetical protein n=1 Tax=Ochrobactrum sp. MYb379 TaxID=2745275 RepID=UPI0030A5D8CC